MYSIVQEISDDIGRHNSDAQVNSATVTVLRGHEEIQTQWKHLQPGDIVKVGYRQHITRFELTNNWHA